MFVVTEVCCQSPRSTK